MSEIDDLWRTGLKAEALTIELDEGGSAERVVRRARRRSTRRRGAVGVVASGMVVASGLAWQANRAAQRDKAQDLVVRNEPDAADADGTTGGGAALPVASTGFQIVDPATLPDVPLSGAAPAWSAEDVPWGRAMTYSYSSVRAGSGGLVGVSTAPGVSTDGQVGTALYTSSDGVTWKGAALDGSHWFGDIVPSDGRLVAVGTAAATGKIDASTSWAAGDVVIALSDDQGRSWRDVVLPVDLRGVADRLKAKGGDGGGVAVTQARIAHGARGWLAAVSVKANIDGRRFLPAGVDTTYGYVSTPEGIAVFAKETDPDRAALQACTYGSGSCDDAAMIRYKEGLAAGRPYTPTVDHVYTWAELGFDAATAELLHGTVKLFGATDGEHFSPVAVPDLVPAGAGTSSTMGLGALVTATADGFALAVRSDTCCTVDQMTRGVSPSTQVHVWRTTDLATWQALDPVDVGETAIGATFGEVGGRLVLIGSQNQLPVVAVADGTRWTLTPLGKPLVKSDEQIVNVMGSVGDGGVAVSTSVLADPWANSGLSISDSGYTLRVESRQRGLSVVDPNGAIILTTPDPYVRVSQDGYTLQPEQRELDNAPQFDSPTTAKAGVYATVPYQPSTTAAGVAIGSVDDMSTVPVTTVSGRSALPATTTTMLTAAGSSSYIVEAGDMAVVIAKRYGITLDMLQSANPGVDLDKIVPGQVLNVPAGAAVEPVQGVGPFSGSVTLTDASGKTLATFDVADMEQRLQELQGASGMGHVRTRVLVSRDAASWSLADLGDVTGTPTATLQNLVVTGDRVLATVNTDETDPSAPKAPYEGMPPFRKTKVVVGRFS